MFEREELLIGDLINELKDKSILIVGVGGVGGYVTESMVRAGIGHLTIVDFDTIDESNLNRQIIALHSNIGKKKVDAFKERILDINPNCKVDTFDIFYDENNKDIIFNDKIDYVIDCCDSVNSKILLIKECKKRNIPIISSMGTGNKFHPEMFKIDRLNKTAYDPLAKKVRFLLKNDKELLDTMVLYSTETPTEYKGKVGSISYVPSVAGLLITSYVINQILDK
ncbi:MAG: tRNA threonylcarbamoyladenosine dehydratase [Bacilli bacterium]|nr:tRNA threonylcarbamoyladenosine dehydratase [Bacilli bacterium]